MPASGAALADGEPEGGAEAFLIPSVFGDEPQLRDLRRRLRGVLRFDVLDLPDAGARGAILTDMVATGRSLVHEIARRQPAGPVRLVGYSFGASLALEIAAQLRDTGRDVAFLGVLDGPFEPPTVAPRSTGEAFLAAPRRLVRSVAVDAAESLDSVRRLMARAAAPAPASGGRAEPMRRAMLWHLRNKALRTWTPRPCLAAGLHVSTGDYGPGNRARWAELCPNLLAVEVLAVHEHLLKDAALDAVAAALAAAALALPQRPAIPSSSRPGGGA